MKSRKILRIITKTTKRITLFVAAAVMAASSFYAPALAQPADEQKLNPYYYTNNGIIFYGVGNGCETAVVGTPGDNIDVDAAREVKVRTIIGVAKSLGLTPKAAVIAFMTVFQESGFRNYGNRRNDELRVNSETNPNFEGFPSHGGDHYSVGIFQQQVTTGWSTYGNGYSKDIVWQIMGAEKNDHAVAYSAQAFFGTPADGKLPSNLKQPSALKKGLVNRVPNYNDASVRPGVAAQTVQVSAFPDAYDKWESKAQQLVNQYWESSPAIPLAVPIDGSLSNEGSTGDCSELTGDAISRLLQIIKRYSWPDYRRAGTAGATEKNEAYTLAVNAAKARGDYVGDRCLGGGVDCGGFVTLAMIDSGADPEYNNKKGPTGTQWEYLRENSIGPSPKYKLVSPNEALQPGDIAIRDGHTFFYIGKQEGMNGDSASASQCERAPMAGPSDTRSEYYWYRLIRGS